MIFELYVCLNTITMKLFSEAHRGVDSLLVLVQSAHLKIIKAQNWWQKGTELFRYF